MKAAKIPSDFFEYPQIIELEELPNGDTLILLWMKIFIQAKKKKRPHGNCIVSINGIELTDHFLKRLFNMHCTDKVFADLVKTLEKHRLLRREKTKITVVLFWQDLHDRSSRQYVEWRNAVLKRDDYRCKICGKRGRLQAHHIIYWRDTVDSKWLRYDVENGITLCTTCHLEAHGGNWRNG